MKGLWEIALNISPKFNNGDNIITLASILSSIKVNNNDFELNKDYSTIRYITDREYSENVYRYVEPAFYECEENSSPQPKFLLFSAPGATGKSALAQHICHAKNGIYWDLPDNKVAEFSFEGAIAKAVGFSYMSNFIESLENGENFFVIDAFDEAEAGSGRTGIEFFLRDLNEVTKNCNHVCAILMARTESAIFIKKYFLNNGIPFKHFEVGYFAEYNAKTYIRNGLEKLNIPITNVANICIDEQFNEIKRILISDTDAFLGYAPVLNALAASYDSERNTLNLLKNIAKAENTCELMKKILDDLLQRERDKFIKALKVKIPEIKDCSELVYDENEQLFRIFGMILFNDSTLFVNVDESIPIEFHEEYLEVVNTQLPQHPFIQSKVNGLDAYYDFTGTAFRDFVIAYGLASDETRDFVDEYLSDNKKYCPSQMLIEFYSLFSDKSVSGKHIPLMYNSFKAHAQLGDKISVYINGDKNDCSVEFNLEREVMDKTEFNIFEFNIIDLEEGIHVNQLSNCYIDIEGKVYIGNPSGEARIDNSVINCDEIVWCSEHVAIEAYSPGNCMIITNEFSSVPNTIPRFEIKTDDKKNLKISCPILNKYFKLLPYKCDNTLEGADNDFISFSNLLRRIFGCLRSHSKDTPARKMDFIDNRIINSNSNKKNILNFLLKEHILYTDKQDWLYKLDTSKLSYFSINGSEIREGKYDTLNYLYGIYAKESGVSEK